MIATSLRGLLSIVHLKVMYKLLTIVDFSSCLGVKEAGLYSKKLRRFRGKWSSARSFSAYLNGLQSAFFAVKFYTNFYKKVLNNLISLVTNIE